MSELLQSGQHSHPDADQLSAFVEQALPAHEREQVLAHLAVCADCRETVALSLPYLEAPQIQEPTRRPWFRGWTVFVPAAAALAASIFFAVSIHRARIGRGIAVQPAQIATSQRPAPVPPPTEAPAPRTAVPVAKQSRPEDRRVLAPAAPPLERQRVDMLAAAPQAMPPAPVVAIASNNAKPAASTSGSGVATSIQSPAMPLAATPSPSATNAPPGSATQTVAVTHQAPILNTASASLDLSITPPAQAIVFKHPLPSGQAPLSVAVNGRLILAIDARNAVYLSRDSGRHWTLVSTPWRGRAIRAELVSRNAVLAPAAGALQNGRMAAFAAAAAPTLPVNTASLTGAVTDATGAAIPNATVILRNTASNTERTLITDANGRYLAGNLAPGSYTIDARAAGFQEQHITGIVVAPTTQSVQNLTLQVGAVGQSIEVTGGAEAVPINSAVVSKALKIPAYAPLQPAFAITTDTGERWTSTDGVTWQRQ